MGTVIARAKKLEKRKQPAVPKTQQHQFTSLENKLRVLSEEVEICVKSTTKVSLVFSSLRQTHEVKVRNSSCAWRLGEW